MLERGGDPPDLHAFGALHCSEIRKAPLLAVSVLGEEKRTLESLASEGASPALKEIGSLNGLAVVKPAIMADRQMRKKKTTHQIIAKNGSPPTPKKPMSPPPPSPP